MECPSCKKNNTDGTVFCSACGWPLLPEGRVFAVPGELDCLASNTFVGRESEIQTLRADLDSTLTGQGRVLFLVGEPGIGKTRLANELAIEARLRGTQVLVGRCYEGEGAPPFWPWVQIFRSYLSTCNEETLRAEMGVRAADIAQVIPDVREQMPDLPVPAGLESEEARFRFFDSVTRFLKNSARRQPLVLILDDLHWADKPSLLLLQFLARELHDVRLLVVGTYRDIQLGHHHPLSQTLGEIAREPGSQSLSLGGLSEPEVAHFIANATSRPPSAALVSTLYQETEGNPFFLTAVVHLLVNQSEQFPTPSSQSPTPFPIPQGVRAAIGRRLEALSEECQQMLTLAAVLGREFRVDALEQVGARAAALFPTRPLLQVEAEKARGGNRQLPTGDRLLEVLEEAEAAVVTASHMR